MNRLRICAIAAFVLSVIALVFMALPAYSYDSATLEISGFEWMAGARTKFATGSVQIPGFVALFIGLVILLIAELVGIFLCSDHPFYRGYATFEIILALGLMIFSFCALSFVADRFDSNPSSHFGLAAGPILLGIALGVSALADLLSLVHLAGD